jgi:hypothetical protein
MTRRLILLLAIMLGAFVWGAEMRAQCACPDGVGDVTQNIVICLGGANHTVSVTYCNVIMSPPDFHACADRKLDMVTSIKKVCNPPTGFTDSQILEAVHCAMDPAKGNYFNIQASHFTVYSGGQTLFCWVIGKPRCTTRDGSNCIIVCQGLCCYVWEEYELDGGGNIMYRPGQVTPDCLGGMCQTGCNTSLCRRPSCDCP